MGREAGGVDHGGVKGCRQTAADGAAWTVLVRMESPFRITKRWSDPPNQPCHTGV